MENLKLKNNLIAIKLLYNVHSVYFQVDSVKYSCISNSSANRQIENEGNVWKVMFGLRVQFSAVNSL